MKIGVKYDQDRCGGTLYFEDDLGRTSRERFRCETDGHPSKTKNALPEAVYAVLLGHCWNNCRPARWRSRGARPLSGFGATAAEVRQLVSAWPRKTMNRYAQTYVEALDDAERMGGAEGIQFQANYILGYLRAKTPEQKAAKKKLQDIGRGLAGLGGLAGYTDGQCESECRRLGFPRSRVSCTCSGGKHGSVQLPDPFEDPYRRRR